MNFGIVERFVSILATENSKKSKQPLNNKCYAEGFVIRFDTKLIKYRQQKFRENKIKSEKITVKKEKNTSQIKAEERNVFLTYMNKKSIENRCNNYLSKVGLDEFKKNINQTRDKVIEDLIEDIKKSHNEMINVNTIEWLKAGNNRNVLESCKTIANK